MSIAEVDKQDRVAVLHYAPRHVRYPSEECSIRPVLERLSRGENGTPGDAEVEPDVHARVTIDPPRRTIDWQLIACSALSAGLSAGLAVLAIGWLVPIKTEPDGTQLEPKIVRTVSIQPTQAPPDAGSPAAAKQDVKQEAVPTPDSKDEPRQIAPNELLTMWSGIPTEGRAETADASTGIPTAPDVQGPKEPQTEAPPAPRGEHSEAAPRRQAHTHRRSARRAYAAQRSSAQSNETAAAAPQTTESNPLQSALQSVFGGQAAAKPQPAPQQQSGGASAPAQQQNY